MSKKRMSTSEIITYGVAILIGCAVVLYAGISLVVDKEITAICEEACSKYPGPKIDALVTYLEKSKNLKKKNRVVWALGELRDPKALLNTPGRKIIISYATPQT